MKRQSRTDLNLAVSFECSVMENGEQKDGYVVAEVYICDQCDDVHLRLLNTMHPNRYYVASLTTPQAERFAALLANPGVSQAEKQDV